MSLLPERPQCRDSIVSAAGESYLELRQVPKRLVTPLAVWLGSRQYGENPDDLSAFQMACLWGGIPTYTTAEAATVIEDMENPVPLEGLARDLVGVLDRIVTPFAAFVVTTATTAKRSWSDSFCAGIRDYRFRARGIDDTAVYKIIMGGGWTNEEYLREDPEGHYRGIEMSAHNLDGYELYYNSDAPTAGCTRLADFMNRLLGRDLPGEFFPGYSVEEIKKIAWNINRESFNAFGERLGSIPKYPIDPISGRPVFPW